MATAGSPKLTPSMDLRTTTNIMVISVKCSGTIRWARGSCTTTFTASQTAGTTLLASHRMQRRKGAYHQQPAWARQLSPRPNGYLFGMGWKHRDQPGCPLVRWLCPRPMAGYQTARVDLRLPLRF